MKNLIYNILLVAAFFLMPSCFFTFPGVTSCSSGEDCPIGSDCLQGSCLPIPCETDGDCVDRSVCINSRCTVRNCNNDSDCGYNFSCKMGVCTWRGIPKGSQDTSWSLVRCNADVDCQDNEICVTSSMVNANDYSYPESLCAVRCKEDSDCPNKELCLGRWCTKTRETNTSEYNYCTGDLLSQKREPTRWVRCGGGYICIENTCMERYYDHYLLNIDTVECCNVGKNYCFEICKEENTTKECRGEKSRYSLEFPKSERGVNIKAKFCLIDCGQKVCPKGFDCKQGKTTSTCWPSEKRL